MLRVVLNEELSVNAGFSSEKELEWREERQKAIRCLRKISIDVAVSGYWPDSFSC